MADRKFDVVGIGNAIVDVLARVDEAFLSKHDLTKGAMMLIDADRALYLSEELEEPEIKSGGSAGNTIAGLAELGAKTAFFGKVADDHMGEQYVEDMKRIGVHFPTDKISDQEPTARSIIVISPDGERTMNTYLGASTRIGPNDVDEDVVRQSAIVYFEGYLWDPPLAKDALRRAAEIAHDAGNQVSLTLSDAFCVDRYRDEFKELIETQIIDILFANEAELLSLYQTDDFEAALDLLSKKCPLAAITRSEKGAVILKDGQKIRIAAKPVANVVDSTGAGDMFAAGFLFGLSQNKPLQECGEIACLLASRIIQVVGPRLDEDLRKILTESGFDV